MLENIDGLRMDGRRTETEQTMEVWAITLLLAHSEPSAQVS